MMSRWFLRVCVWGVIVLCGSAHHATAQLPANEGMRKPSMSWIDIPDDAMYKAPVFTAECLVRVRAGGLIVTRDVSSGSPSDWQLYFEPSTRRIAFITAATPPDSYFYTTSSYEYDRWYHVALVVNGPQGRAALYIDGTRVLAPTFSPRSFNGSTGLAWGGYYANASGAYLDGDFDEARYWNVERTPAQITANMLRRLDINDRAGLIGYWMFCGNYADSSGTGHDATVHAAPSIVAFPELPPALSCGTAPLRLAPDTSDILCSSSCITLRAGVLAGSPPFRHAWTNQSGAPLGDTDTLHICPTTGTTVTVRVTDALGDQAVRAFRITVHPRPSRPAIWRLGDSLYCTPAPSIQWYRDGAALAGETGPILRITAEGAYSVRVTNAYGCDSTSLALQAAPGTGGDCLVWIPHLEGSPGERIDVPVIATCADALRLAGTARAAVTLARREGILFERPPVAPGVHAADERVVDLDIDLAAAAGDTIARLPFTAMLGTVRETPLRIARIAFAPVDRPVRTRDGSFRLRVCEEGGERLFDADVRMDLTARGGTPFNADLVVDYTLPAEASVRLVLVDALGRTVAVLADGLQAKGAHTVRHAGTALASGVYLCVLTAENMRRVVAVHHLK